MSTPTDGRPTGSHGDPLAADEAPGGHAVPDTSPGEPFDGEIGLRPLWWTAIGLVVTVIVSAGVVWFLLKGFDRFDSERDPVLPPIRTAVPQEEPPLPRLQSTPEQDLRTLRDKEAEALDRAAWVDPRQGIVRVPIDVAIEAIARRGIAPFGAPTAPEPAPAPAPAAGNPQEIP